MEYLKSHIRDVYDFPQKGVIFRDLTTLFKDPRGLHIIGWDLSQLYRDKGVTKVVGIESRGFIGGSILAFELGAGFVPVRKPGKLPADTIKASYYSQNRERVFQSLQDRFRQRKAEIFSVALSRKNFAVNIKLIEFLREVNREAGNVARLVLVRRLF